jgi:putative MATE family efflux protein
MMTAETQALKGRDLTSGGLHASIWHLAVPMTLEMIVLNVSFALDTYWVGQLGEAAVAAVTISMAIRWVMNGLANGLGIGGMATVARRIGEKNRAAADHATTQTIILGIIISIVLAAIGNLMAQPMLDILGAEPDVMPLATTYLRVTMTGLFAMILIFTINSMLRGAGDARIALRALILASAVTVVLEPVLVLGLGPIPAIGITGSAWAFVLGFTAGITYQLWVLLTGRARISIDLRDTRPDLPLMGRIIRIALPSTVQMTLRSSSRLAIIALIGVYGTATMAAYGVANRLLIFVIIPTFGLGNACSALIGQNLGAEKPERAERTAWWVSAYAVAFTVGIVAIIMVAAPVLIDFFVQDASIDVLNVGTEYLYIVTPSLLAMAVGIVLGRAFDGAGNTVPAMLINLITLWGIEVAVSFVLSRWLGMGATGVWLGRSLAGIANGFLFAIWFRRGRWKLQVV